MNLNPREKLLAILIAAAVVVIVGVWGTLRLTSAFDVRGEAQAQLDAEIGKKETLLARGERAEKRIAALAPRSLPANLDLARSVYLTWLQERARRHGFEAVKTAAPQRRPLRDIGFQHTFTLDGQAELREMAAFLHDFHALDLLHRVRSLSVNPVEDTRQLQVTLTIDAISLNAAHDVRSITERQRPGAESLIAEHLLSRNLFGPPNQPPRVASLGSPQAYPGKSFTLKIPAEDPDQLDKLTYALEGTAPAGATLDPATGELRFTPGEKGEVEVSVRVADDGLPSRSVQQTIKIAIVDPPPPPPPPPPTPPPPGFNAARFAKITGITGSGRQRFVWVNVQTEGRLVRLTEGERIDIGTIKGTVKAIRDRDAEFELEGGGVVVVGLGRTLVEDPATTGS